MSLALEQYSNGFWVYSFSEFRVLCLFGYLGFADLYFLNVLVVRAIRHILGTAHFRQQQLISPTILTFQCWI